MPASPYFSNRDDALTEDPLLGFNFLLELEGAIAGYFTEVSGIGSEHEIVEHKVVDKQGHEVIRKIPGRLKWGDINLKRGVTSDLQIWKWRDQVVKGDILNARKNISITMLDRSYKPVGVWHFTKAWPSKVDGPTMKADDNSYASESVTIVHEGGYRET
jgi:phage tail-like protein